jgi:hypothetical protein
VLEGDIGRSRRYTLERWRRRPASERLRERFAVRLRSQL